MAAMSQAKRFRKESELLIMLEDSELSSGLLFHSDENNSDSDSENLGDNPEIVDDVQQGGANENIIAGTWSNDSNFDELEEHENLAGPNHNLPYGSSEKDSFDLYVGRDFCELVANQTNIHAEYIQRKSGGTDTNCEDTNVDEIRVYVGVLIYMGLVDLPEIDYYFLGDFCVCHIVRQAMTLKRFRKLGQYLHFNSQENRPGPQD
jgi:hypothetical protein